MGYNPPLISGPIPPESNPPINPQYYQPSVFQISALSLGPLTTVTTSVNHNYVIGQLIRLVIPQQNGSYEVNEEQGYVLSIPAANQVIVSINSSNANTFIASTSSTQWQPQIMAIGDINTGPINSQGRSNTSTIVQGSFINISPA